MWIKLTRPDLEPVLVNAAKITHVTARGGGGSSLYMELESVDKKGEAKQRILACRETTIEVFNLLKAAEGGAPATTQKLRAAR
jgi:hypothetical protein